MEMTDNRAIDAPGVLTDPEQPKSDDWLEIFSVLVHDIESPLVSIKYLLALVESGNLDLEKEIHRKLVGSSRVAVERAESIIYDIMAVARAGRAGLPVSMTTLVPDTILKEAMLLITPAMTESNIKVDFENSASGVEVKADPKLLKRTFDNLLFNAVRHTPSGGTITVSSELGEESIFYHIKDSGPGLVDVDPKQLFEKFGQVRLRGQGKHRGVGLGLYFCKIAMAAMGGTIVAADHPQGGAVFTIRLQKAEV